MSSNAEFFQQRWESEQAAFRKVIAAVPGDQLDYRPHERSATAGGLAWQLADEQRGLVELLEKCDTAYENRPRPATIEEIVAAWDHQTEAVRKALASRDDSKWEKPANFRMGGEVVWTDTLQNMLWGFLFDMVHHRGQLSSYLRPMGANVPAIYGPSADEQS
jgi:uncharacterized damage-inducible protein DinB